MSSSETDGDSETSGRGDAGEGDEIASGAGERVHHRDDGGVPREGGGDGGGGGVAVDAFVPVERDLAAVGGGDGLSTPRRRPARRGV